MFECKKGIKVFPWGSQTILSFTKGLENQERSNMIFFLFPLKLFISPVLILNAGGLIVIGALFSFLNPKMPERGGGGAKDPSAPFLMGPLQ